MFGYRCKLKYLDNQTSCLVIKVFVRLSRQLEVFQFTSITECFVRLSRCLLSKPAFWRFDNRTSIIKVPLYFCFKINLKGYQTKYGTNRISFMPNKHTMEKVILIKISITIDQSVFGRNLNKPNYFYVNTQYPSTYIHF